MTSLVYINVFMYPPLELQRNNLSNPEAYSETCETSKMECLQK